MGSFCRYFFLVRELLSLTYYNCIHSFCLSTVLLVEYVCVLGYYLFQGKGSEELTVHPPHITRVLFPNKEVSMGYISSYCIHNSVHLLLF